MSTKTIADIEWDFSAYVADVTRKEHELRCCQCGQWLPLLFFTALPVIECRPRCGLCRIKAKGESE
jgi:hypothetical protein